MGNVLKKTLRDIILPRFTRLLHGQRSVSLDERQTLIFLRFLLVVLSAYQQIRHQNEPVLSTEKEDNFDRAFDFFRPSTQFSSVEFSLCTHNVMCSYTREH